MIRTETEYRLTLAQIEKNREAETRQRAALVAAGLAPEHIEIAMEPTITFHMQYVEDVQWYERVRAGDLPPIKNLNHIGQVLIGLRIAGGLTQKELAERLGVSEQVVSRDERNDYHGISVERAQRVLDALEGQAMMIVNPPARKTDLAREMAAV